MKGRSSWKLGFLFLSFGVFSVASNRPFRQTKQHVERQEDSLSTAPHPLCVPPPPSVADVLSPEKTLPRVARVSSWSESAVWKRLQDLPGLQGRQRQMAHALEPRSHPRDADSRRIQPILPGLPFARFALRCCRSVLTPCLLVRLQLGEFFSNELKRGRFFEPTDSIAAERIKWRTSVTERVQARS